MQNCMAYFCAVFLLCGLPGQGSQCGGFRDNTSPSSDMYTSIVTYTNSDCYTSKIDCYQGFDSIGAQIFSLPSMRTLGIRSFWDLFGMSFALYFSVVLHGTKLTFARMNLQISDLQQNNILISLTLPFIRNISRVSIPKT